jgi:hypothetical protein
MGVPGMKKVTKEMIERSRRSDEYGCDASGA